MYPGKYAKQHPDKPAFIMAESGETVSYGEYEARCNRLAHLLRDQGLQREEHYAIFMENNARYMESCGAGERAGLYYTCVNSYLTADELAYIVNNSESQILITSQSRREVALAAMGQCPDLRLCLVVDGPGAGEGIVNLDEAVAPFPDSPIADQALGMAMLYSSGTTGQPKGILRPMPDEAPDHNTLLFNFLQKLWRYREGMIYLSPAPLYHSAPHAAVNFTIRFGGTAIIMERFDPEDYLALIGKYRITHSQLVPTMFSRMLKLPDEVRNSYD
ncbi:MAG: AMP-binding protein, partial [Alphaproteobacteria bacterium]|nr:AMP-binding protein [Alphaproteobacteria bacterium]